MEKVFFEAAAGGRLSSPAVLMSGIKSDVQFAVNHGAMMTMYKTIHITGCHGSDLTRQTYKKQIHNKIAKLAAGFNCNTLCCKCYGKLNR